MELPPLEYRTTRLRMAMYALGSLLFVLVAIVMVSDPEQPAWVPIFGWLGIAFFGFCLIVSIKEMLRPRIGMRLDAEGVHAFHALGGNAFELPWTQLAGMRVAKIQGQPIIVFDAHDPEWGMEGISNAVRRMRKANALLVGSWMTVAPKVFGVKPEQVVADVDRYYRHYTPDAPVEYPRAGGISVG